MPLQRYVTFARGNSKVSVSADQRGFTNLEKAKHRERLKSKIWIRRSNIRCNEMHHGRNGRSNIRSNEKQNGRNGRRNTGSSFLAGC